jgi:DNA repair photolyase
MVLKDRRNLLFPQEEPGYLGGMSEHMSSGPSRKPPRGRGATGNPINRFAPYDFTHDPETAGGLPDRPRTQYFQDTTRSILSQNRSPDLPFKYSLNPYRGCEHGCSYCYARQYHEFLGFSAGLDFETRLIIKHTAPRLLRETLSRPSWHPQPIFFSGGTDAYQPLEKKLRLTRRCLEVLAEFHNPVSIITKNRLITRDLDLLKELATHQAASVWISLISLDRHLLHQLEPRASSPRARLETVQHLAHAGIPVGVMVAPVIPGLTDHEIPRILEAAANAGAQFATFSLLRLPGSVEKVFRQWIEAVLPGKALKVMGKLQECQTSGALRSSIRQLFHLHARRRNLQPDSPRLSAASFRDPQGTQLRLFV